MNPVWRVAAKVLSGISVSAMCAFAQYTISARPGVVNLIEGDAFINGVSLAGHSQSKATFLNANDTFSTGTGKAEVLLSPGVYLRVGDSSEIRMISPSLVHTQFEVIKGEAIVEVAEFEKGSDVQVIDHGASITLQKAGLYRFMGDNLPTVATLEGKADVAFGERSVEVGKGHEAVLDASLTQNKFDTKKEDDLYAWSNVRDQYSAASSLQLARNVSTSSYGGGWYGYGFDGWSSPGWYWNGAFSSYAWLPGFSNAFNSPFGYGYYGPGVVGYAPILYVPVNGGYVPGRKVTPMPTGTGLTRTATMAVAVNPAKPPAVGSISSVSPFVNSQARTQMARTFGSSGYATASGGHVAASSGNSSAGVASLSSGTSGGGHVSAASAGGGGAGGRSSGGGGHR